jgi:hypothetical protein
VLWLLSVRPPAPEICRRVQPRRLVPAPSPRASSQPARRLEPLRLAMESRAAAWCPERRERLAQQRSQAARPESAMAFRPAPLARWAQRRREKGWAKACRPEQPERWAPRQRREGSAEACHPERREQQASQRSLAARRCLGALARRARGRRRAEWLPLAGSEAAWALAQRRKPGRQGPQRLPGLPWPRALGAVPRRAFLDLPADRPVGQTARSALAA